MTSSPPTAAAPPPLGGLEVASAAPCAMQAGQVIAGRYRIESEVGRGGMGVVYSAQHLLTARPVALKLLGERAGQTDERALHEARSAASLCHPNVVEVLDLDLHDGAPFLVMELLTGEALSAATPGARDAAQLLRWMLPVLGAVAALHERGYVHGDLKPANVLLHRQGPQIVPKLIDFGLASALFDRSLVAAPVYGTPRYMAPERASGADLTVQADVWSLGMTLLECLAGGSAEPGSLAALRPDLPAALVLAVERALQPDLQLRHATIRALARSLVEACWLTGIVLPDHPDPVALPELPSWRRGAHQRPLSETHSVEAERPGSRRGTRMPAWVVPALLAVGTLAAWVSWSHITSVASTPRRAAVHGPLLEPRATPLRPRQEPRAAFPGPQPEARAATVPALPSAPPPDERTPQRPTSGTTVNRSRPKAAARRVHTATQAPELEGEVDDITGEWR